MFKKAIFLSPYYLIPALILVLSHGVKAQQLVINEVSQGGQNPTVEYVELVVQGTPACNATGMDIRNWIIDDNNGLFASGAGTGIAAGCVRFRNIAFWQNVKIGTIILIYDDGVTSVNPLIPADDLSNADGNCRLVIPYSNTSLIEKHATTPGINNSSYPTGATAFNSTNGWGAVIGMRNGGDSFQIRKPNATATSYSLNHAVSWGDNNNSTIIYFQGDASKRVFSMKNTISNDPSLQANWGNDSTLTGETPGVGNNAANTAWIVSMNNNCQAFTGAALTISSSSPGPDFCTGDTVTLSSSIVTGNNWSTGDTSNTIKVSASASITLTNAAACTTATRTLNFTSTTAGFTADTTQGIAPLTVHFANASQANAIDFNWTMGDTASFDDSLSLSYTYKQPGTYAVILTVKNSAGCSDTAVRIITVLDSPKDPSNIFEIPNVFTPNGDGNNDLFLIKNNNVQSFSGLIFDRWGNKVHEWTNLNEGWNGRTKAGMQVTAGVFFYLMNVTFADGSSITPSGTITLIK